MSQYIKKYFITGLIVTVPIVITYFTIIWLFSAIDGIMEPLWSDYFGKHIPGLGFITTILVILIFGFLATNVIGKTILDLMEKVILNVPVSRSIYSTTKQLMDSFSPTSKVGFKQVVMVKYPDNGSYSIGFLTKELKFKDSVFAAVYIPTNHVYLGNIVIVKREYVDVINVSVEDALKAVLTSGASLPAKIDIREIL